MITTVRATVRKGHLVPAEKLDMADGEEVDITISLAKKKGKDDAFLRSAGSWKGIVDCEKLIRDIYRSRSRISHRKVPRL